MRWHSENVRLLGVLLHSPGIIVKYSNACDIQLFPLFSNTINKKNYLTVCLIKSWVTSPHTRPSLNDQFHLKRIISYQTKCMLVFREKTRCVITMNTTWWRPWGLQEFLHWLISGKSCSNPGGEYLLHDDDIDFTNSPDAEKWRIAYCGLLCCVKHPSPGFWCRALNSLP